MPRRCAATLPLFGKRYPYAEFPFLSSWRRRSGGRARGDRHISWLVGVEGVARRNIPVDSSGLIIRVECGIVTCGMRCVPSSIVLTFIGGVEIGDGMDGSGEWGMFASST